jgi:hypothetical protein
MRTGIGAVALAAAAILGAGSSAAATTTTWTVRPGGAITAKAGKTTLTDSRRDNTLTCTSSTMAGTLKPGSGLPGTGIGSITAATYRCPTPIFSYRLTPRGLPWHLNLASYDPRTGVARGTISHLQLAFAIPEVFCSVLIGGASGPASGGVVAVTYSNQTGRLKILPTSGTLHWYDPDGCDHIIRDGDPATLTASYAISPSQTIISP